MQINNLKEFMAFVVETMKTFGFKKEKQIYSDKFFLKNYPEKKITFSFQVTREGEYIFFDTSVFVETDYLNELLNQPSFEHLFAKDDEMSITHKNFKILKTSCWYLFFDKYLDKSECIVEMREEKNPNFDSDSVLIGIGIPCFQAQFSRMIQYYLDIVDQFFSGKIRRFSGWLGENTEIYSAPFYYTNLSYLFYYWAFGAWDKRDLGILRWYRQQLAMGLIKDTPHLSNSALYRSDKYIKSLDVLETLAIEKYGDYEGILHPANHPEWPFNERVATKIKPILKTVSDL